MAAVWTSIAQTETKVTGLSATDAAPVSQADGIDTRGMHSFSLTLECDAAQSFVTAAGHLEVYWFDPFVGAWSYVVDADQQIPPQAIGKRRITFVLDLLNPRGRIALIPVGLDITLGSITEYYAPVLSR